MFSLVNKKAVITGGGSGIGKAIAVTFAAQGAAVHVLELTTEAGADTAATIKSAGGQVSVHACNVANKEEVTAVFASIGQLDVLEQRVLARRSNFDYYKKGLINKEGIIFLDEKQGFYSNRWLTCITVIPNKNKYSREEIRLLLENDNIESRPLWKPMHLQPIFNKYHYIGGDVAENLFKNGLCLPSGSNLITEDLDRVIEIINKD
mgnify:CR=1 FL=1